MRKVFASFLLSLFCLLWASPYEGGVILVIIDAGHGGSDPGASAFGCDEKDLTLSIARALESELAGRGVETVMIRDDDRYISLEERCDEANSQNFDLSGYPVFVSLHINSAENPAAEGFEVYTRPEEHETAMLSQSSSDSLMLKYSDYTAGQLSRLSWRVSSRLAENICAEVAESLPELRMRGVKSENFWVLNGTWMPSVLVEAGFISNRSEASLMGTEDFQERLARAIADAVCRL